MLPHELDGWYRCLFDPRLCSVERLRHYDLDDAITVL